MTKHLPIFSIFYHSYLHIKHHLASLSIFFLLSFVGIYLLGGFNLMDNPLGGLIYIIYTYIFYFCLYTGQQIGCNSVLLVKPLLENEEM